MRITNGAKPYSKPCSLPSQMPSSGKLCKRPCKMKKPLATSAPPSMPDRVPQPVALLIGSLDLWLRTPNGRSDDPDWPLEMQQQLDWLAKESRGLPIVCAGSVFRKWAPRPEVINFALEVLPRIYAVPGENDLFSRKRSLVKHSAYWTLVQTGKITDLNPGASVDVPGAIPVRLHGFGWGTEAKKLYGRCDFAIEVAVVHEYCWRSGSSVPNPRKWQFAGRWREKLGGFEVAVFGGNHLPFIYTKDSKIKPIIFNCGTFFRRRDKDTPSYGVLYSNGAVEQRFIQMPANGWSVQQGRPKENAR